MAKRRGELMPRLLCYALTGTSAVVAAAAMVISTRPDGEGVAWLFALFAWAFAGLSGWLIGLLEEE